MNHNMPSDNGPEEIKMKQAACFGILFGAIGTVLASMNHMLGWTVFGLILVLANIFLLTYKPEDTGE